MNAAQQGEAPGRWFGRGAAGLSRRTWNGLPLVTTEAYGVSDDLIRMGLIALILAIGGTIPLPQQMRSW